MSSEGALMSGSATAAAQSTTSMLTRNTAPKPAPLADQEHRAQAGPACDQTQRRVAGSVRDVG
jgi:hypothetical protein